MDRRICCNGKEVTIIDKKSAYLTETIFIYIFSFLIISVVSSVLFKADFYDKFTFLLKPNSFLSLSWLAAAFLGMALAPLLWERAVRKTEFKEIGFTIPPHIYKELTSAIILFIFFGVYVCLLHKKISDLFNLKTNFLFAVLFGWLILATAEEILYRGVIQRRLSFLFGKWPGLILATLIFAFLGHPKASLSNNLMLRLPFGLILGYFYSRTQSLLIPIGMHWGFNILFAF